MWKLTLLQSVDEIPVIVESAEIHGDTIIQVTHNCENILSGAYPAHILTIKRNTLSNVMSGKDVFLSVSMEVGDNRFIHNALVYSLAPTK
jgi:hypothetical protein